MRNVKVYVISETVKAVAGNFVEFYEYGVPALRVFTLDQALDDETCVLARRVLADVHCRRDVGGAETFFALHPDVAELLATPASLDVVARARSEADEVVRRVRESEDRALARYRCERLHREALQARVDAWKSLPWFLRVWRALRRDL